MGLSCAIDIAILWIGRADTQNGPPSRSAGFGNPVGAAWGVRAVGFSEYEGLLLKVAYKAYGLSSYLSVLHWNTYFGPSTMIWYIRGLNLSRKMECTSRRSKPIKKSTTLFPQNVQKVHPKLCYYESDPLGHFLSNFQKIIFTF